MIFPIVSLDCNLTICGTEKSKLESIYTFLQSNELSNHPLSKILPVSKSSIYEENNKFYFDCGSYRSNFTAMTKIEFTFEYIRIVLSIYKNFHIFIRFYVPQIPPNENDRDFLYCTMLSHILIPVKITQFNEYDQEMAKNIVNLTQKYLKRKFFNTYTLVEQNIIRSLMRRIYYSLRNNDIIMNSTTYRILQYNDYMYLIYLSNGIIIKQNLIEIISRPLRITNLLLINQPKYFYYKMKEYLIKVLFQFKYDNQIVSVGAVKYDNKKYSMFCEIDNVYYDINEIDINRHFIINTLIFSLYNLRYDESDIYKTVNNISIFGKSILITLLDGKKIELFLLGNELDKLILTEIKRQ